VVAAGKIFLPTTACEKRRDTPTTVTLLAMLRFALRRASHCSVPPASASLQKESPVSLEVKDYVSFTFSAAAFGLSVYNLLRARRELMLANRRTFEQKRFEAAATAAEVMNCYARIEGALQGLRFEALRSGNSAVLIEAEKHIDVAKARRASYGTFFQQYIALTGPTVDPGDLLELEKQLGKLLAQKASVAEYETLATTFIEDGRRLILAESPTAQAVSVP
jgi:hypothetical protein